MFVVTLTFSFQGQIWNLLYLSQKWSDCHETKSKHIDWAQGLKCNHQVWPWPWPWPWIFKVKYGICCISTKSGMIAMERKANISIELKASNVTIRFDLGHDLDLEFSRSNMEFAIFQPKVVRLPRNEKQTYRLNFRPQMGPMGLTLTMTLTFEFSRSNDYLWPHTWPWPWIFMVKFWNSCISEWEGRLTFSKGGGSRSFMTMTMTIWWPRSGVRLYQIVTGVTSDVDVPSTHLVYGKIIKFWIRCWIFLIYGWIYIHWKPRVVIMPTLLLLRWIHRLSYHGNLGFQSWNIIEKSLKFLKPVCWNTVISTICF